MKAICKGIILFGFLVCGGLAAKPAPQIAMKLSHCETTLKMISLHLGEVSKTRSNQAYYEHLYHQTQNFLDTMGSLPSTDSQLARCQNLLTVAQDIMGRHVVPVDLGPMPHYDHTARGSLTSPVIEAGPRRLFRKHIQYVYHDGGLKQLKNKHKINEEVDQLHLIAKKDPPMAKMRRHSPTGERKDLE